MKILFLHPEDSITLGAWSASHWDLVIDLGYASSFTYDEWSRRLRTPIFSIHQFAGQGDGYRWVNAILEHGRGQLLDDMGLDWWEIVAAWSYQDLHALYLFHQVRSQIDSNTHELAASRPHGFTKIVEQVLGVRIRYFATDSSNLFRKAKRMVRSVRNLVPAQIAEIALDKWDPNYKVRRRLNLHKRARLTEPAVLMPSSYSNVTRTMLAYAALLPHRRFILATTRTSALPAILPLNVTATPLAAYASPSRANDSEAQRLKQEWQIFLHTTIRQVRELENARTAGFWNHFPAHLENGLRLRNAWKELMGSEPLTAVLCGDDLNYYTRLPMMLAYRSELQAVYCSHGALDGGFLFKLPLSDAFLVKGEMEKDYLLRARSINARKIWLSAPGETVCARQAHVGRDTIVFFSSPYEVDGGRCDAIYQELLPRLNSLAEQSCRKLAVKLHPFESHRDRNALVASILPKQALNNVEIVTGVLSEELLSRTWFGVSIDSSVAVECTLKGIPFFLCGWLDFSGVGYLRQFARFGAGRVLEAPEDIDQIPSMVADYKTDSAATDQMWHVADVGQLEKLLFNRKEFDGEDLIDHGVPLRL